MRRAAAFWRQCALLMLLVFVWDICFDLVAPLHAKPDISVSGFGITASGGDAESHPDCGLPDHDCALSHHHHFPAMVSAVQSLSFAVTANGELRTRFTAALHHSAATRSIRAPPVEL